MAVFRSLNSLHPVAGSLLPHCQRLTTTAVLKRSWSHDFLQVTNCFVSFGFSNYTSLIKWYSILIASIWPLLTIFFHRELSKKAQKANNMWWRLSGLLGDQNRLLMFILLQGMFTVATMALTVPIFLSYELSLVFQLLKVSASVWNGAGFLLEVMPRQVILKEKKKSEMQTVPIQNDQW